MQFSENEIRQYAEFAMSTFDFEINPCPTKFDEILERPVTAHIKISGNWQGMVFVVMESDLAQQLAEKMFSCEKGRASKDEINDAISEMTNIIGGNLKSLLPQPCQLSLPIVDKNEGCRFSICGTGLSGRFRVLGKPFQSVHSSDHENRLPNQQSAVETSPVS